jgi:hypothetical protein
LLEQNENVNQQLDTNSSFYDYQRRESIYVAEYRRVLKENGLYPAPDNDIQDFDVHNIPLQPMSKCIDNIVWTLREIEYGKIYQVPTRVYNRWRILQEHFLLVRYLWVEEKFISGNFTPIEYMPTARHPAIQIVQPTHLSAPYQPYPPQPNLGNAYKRKLDPQLIAVNHGCQVGRIAA